MYPLAEPKFITTGVDRARSVGLRAKTTAYVGKPTFTLPLIGGIILTVERNYLNSDQLQELICDRLECIVNQIEHLNTQGLVKEAEILREEGIQLVSVYDSEQNFMYLSDFTEV